MNKIIAVILTFVCSFSFAQGEIEMVAQKGHFAPIHLLTFSFDEQTLAAADDNNDIVIWNVQFGRETNRFHLTDRPVVLSYANHNQKLYCGTENGSFYSIDLVQNLITKKLTIDAKINAIVDLGERHIAVSADKLYQYNIETNELSSISDRKIACFAANTDRSKFIAITTFDEIITYDKNLNETEHFSFLRDKKDKGKKEEKKEEDIDYSQIKINVDKGLICFPTLNSLNVYDIKEDKIIKSFFTDYFDISFNCGEYNVNKDLLAGGTANDQVVFQTLNGAGPKIVKTDHLSEVLALSFSQSGKYVATGSKDQSVIIWETENYRIKHRLSLRALPIFSLSWNDQENMLAAGNLIGEVKLIGLGGEDQSISIANMQAHTELVADLLFHDSVLYSAGFDNKIVITDYHNQVPNHQLVFQPWSKKKDFKMDKKAYTETRSKMVFSMALDQNANQLIAIGKKRYRKINMSFTSDQNDVDYTIDFSELKDLPLTKGYSGLEYSYIETSNFRSWGPKTQRTWINEQDFFQNTSNSIDFYGKKSGDNFSILVDKGLDAFSYSPKHKILGFASMGEVFITFEDDLKSSLLIGSHEQEVTDLIFIDKWDLMLTSSLDGSIKIWSLDQKRLVASLIPIDRDKLIVINKDNYYYSINGGIDAIGFRKNENYYPVEQFDLKFNRPDIVMSSLGHVDSTLIKTYHLAYLKRLKKLNFTEEMLNDEFKVPSVEISNLSEIPPITDQTELALHLHLKNETSYLDRLNIWINDVAIYGSNGKDVRSLNTKATSLEETIELSKGMNKVEVSVLSQSGTESFKESFFIECTNGKDAPDLYLVTIGVSDYQNDQFDLTYPSKDAKDISTLFTSSRYFKEVHNMTLINEQVVLESLSDIKKFLSPAGINDQVIIFIAGHGVRDSKLDYYYASYDMDFSDPSGRGISYDLIESLLDGIKPLRKLLFMDTCHSGELDKDEVMMVETEKEEFENGDIVFRTSGSTIIQKENQMGFKSTSTVMKSLFTDLRKGTGSTVISSASGVEFAMEGEDWKNGLFTYCLLYGIKEMKADLNKDKMITTSEIQLFVQNEVSVMSNGAQTPTSRIENRFMDYRIW